MSFTGRGEAKDSEEATKAGYMVTPCWKQSVPLGAQKGLDELGRKGYNLHIVKSCGGYMKPLQATFSHEVHKLV